MSFYSALILFYPGRSPVRSLGSLRNFCDAVRSTLPFRLENLAVKIAYELDDGAEPNIDWNETNTIGVHKEEWWQSPNWDHAKSGSVWQQLWPEAAANEKLIRRASIDFGPLPHDLGDELTASNKHDSSYNYIIPVKLVVSMGPVAPGSLDDDPSDECYGDLALSFYGMGYFTWQPLSDYWKSARQGGNIQKMLQACRDALPAPTLVEPNIFREQLGELFLNQAEYEPGDWIVSISESG